MWTLLDTESDWYRYHRYLAGTMAGRNVVKLMALVSLWYLQILSIGSYSDPFINALITVCGLPHLG